MTAVIKALEYSLPEGIETIDELVADFPSWSADKVLAKTGIHSRHLAAADEYTSDLGCKAAEQLFQQHDIARQDIDFLIVCTQTPDYQLPTTACLMQDRLGLSQHIGAFDINLGCSGYIYSLGMAKALVESGQARNLLLITADTYTKLINRWDRGVRALFGDGASATLIGPDQEAATAGIGPFIYGTDGAGAESLIVPSSGTRNPPCPRTARESKDRHGNIRSPQNLFMDGRAIVTFTQREIPAAIRRLCTKADLDLQDVDAVVPHQASALVLEQLRHNLNLAEDKFIVNMVDTGNTVSSSIPIALRRALQSGQIKPGSRVLLAGFGVGLSYGATLVRMPDIDP